MIPEASYEGDAIDATWQYWDERPAADETVYATDPEPEGDVSTEDVPVPGRPELAEDEDECQTSLDEWGWTL